jgi:hypothetical protein
MSAMDKGTALAVVMLLSGYGVRTLAEHNPHSIENRDTREDPSI